MKPTDLWLVISLVLVVGLIGGIFLLGWKRRKQKMPEVPPLPPEEDDWPKRP